jgi:hypothetical protein
VTVVGAGTIAVAGAKGHPQAGFLFAVTQSGQGLNGALIYTNPATNDLVESFDINSLNLAGANMATFSGGCFNWWEPCTFTVTVQGNQSVNSFAITGSGFTPEAGNLTSGAIAVSP